MGKGHAFYCSIAEGVQKLPNLNHAIYEETLRSRNKNFRVGTMIEPGIMFLLPLPGFEIIVLAGFCFGSWIRKILSSWVEPGSSRFITGQTRKGNHNVLNIKHKLFI